MLGEKVRTVAAERANRRSFDSVWRKERARLRSGRQISNLVASIFVQDDNLEMCSLHRMTDLKYVHVVGASCCAIAGGVG